MLVLAVLAASCTHDARRFAGPTRGPSFSSVASRSQSSLSTDADQFLVEYTGSTSRLTAAVASVGGAVARVLPEIGLATVLILCAVGVAWNSMVRRRDQEAHDLADHFAEPDRVDEFLKEL